MDDPDVEALDEYEDAGVVRPPPGRGYLGAAPRCCPLMLLVACTSVRPLIVSIPVR